MPCARLCSKGGLTIRNQKKSRPDYISYLLRLWRVNGENEPRPREKAVWRASVEDPNTRERKAFASLDDLFDFLRERTGQVTWGQVTSDVEVSEKNIDEVSDEVSKDEVSKRKGGRP
jgi:hypothetical protein